jgi:DNA-binding LytR/AlgR family response regulator
MEQEFFGMPTEITNVGDYGEAIKFLKEQDFDLALLDVNLGGDGTGLDLIEFIRDEQRNFYMPIIIVTGLADKMTEEAIMLKYDVMYYISKGSVDLFTKVNIYVYSALRAYRKEQLIAKKRQETVERLNTFMDGKNLDELVLMPEVFFNYIVAQLQLADGALVKDGEIIRIVDQSKKEEINRLYQEYVDASFINSVISNYIFIRLREFPGYTFCFVWVSKAVLSESLTQAAELRERIIKIVNNQNTMEALYYLIDTFSPTIFVKAEDIYLVAVKSNEERLLKIPFKMISLYFEDKHFLKINRSIAVNPKEVVKINKISYRKMELILTNGIGVNVSESRVKYVETFFDDF